MSRAQDLFDRIVAGGQAAIDQLIQDFQSESLWLDFKQVATQPAHTKLHDDDRKNLAKAISGFGNSDGGVIVWGVKCKNDPKLGDVPTALVPIDNPTRFVSWLENAVSSCTIPAHQFIEHRAIPEAGGTSTGFAVTLIPASAVAPLQCVQPAGTFQYYIRAGSSFIPAPHAVLAGMFGRRPLPAVRLVYAAATFNVEGDAPQLRLHASAYISLRNTGPTLVCEIRAPRSSSGPTSTSGRTHLARSLASRSTDSMTVGRSTSLQVPPTFSRSTAYVSRPTR